MQYTIGQFYTKENNEKLSKAFYERKKIFN